MSKVSVGFLFKTDKLLYIFLEVKKVPGCCRISMCGEGSIIGSGSQSQSGSHSSNIGKKKRKPPLFSTKKKTLKQLCTRSLDEPTTRSAATHDDAVDVNVFLAKDLNATTFEERERVYEEVHSVATTPEETPKFVQASLAAFDQAIAVVPKYKRKAMELTFFLRPSFANDAKFKLLFLRADSFDATDAATRMIAYFETKRLLFGDEKLAKKRITLEDLSQEDIDKTLLSGYLVVPQVTGYLEDSSGRPAVFLNASKMDFEYYHNVVGSLMVMGVAFA
jgi:hypothetical protein